MLYRLINGILEGMQVSTNEAVVREGGVEAPKQLTADDIFSMLKNSRRRYILSHLQDHRETTIRKLSRDIAGIEKNVDPSEVNHKQRKPVYIALHQTHLPRLADLGIVEYNQDRGKVKGTDRLSVFKPYLGDNTNHPNWGLYSLAVGIVSLSLGVGILGNLPFLSGVPDGAALIFIGSVITTLAILQAGNFVDHPQNKLRDSPLLNWKASSVSADD